MRTFTARPTPVRSPRLLAILVVLLALAAGMAGATMTAEAAPPSHAKGGGGSTSDSGDQKCHPKRGCPDTTSEPVEDPTTEPVDDPSSEPGEDASTSITSVPLVDPAADRNLQHMGQGATASSGDAAVVLTTTKDQVRPRLTVRRGDGAMWHVPLPYDNTYGFENAVYTIDRDNRLHVLGGVLEIVHRRYQLTGTPPTAAALIDTHVYGNSDSRPGAIVALDSGSVVATWHQQGETTAQGHWLLHVTPSNQRQVQELRFIPTKASKSALVQHPADDSVWLFANPDAWGRVGAARLTEDTKGLTVGWTDAFFLGPDDGAGAPDPENPRVYAVPDPASNAVVVGYQSADRILVGGTRASRIALTRVYADASTASTLTPSRTERITSFGLSLSDGVIHVTHPVVEPDGSFDLLRMARLSDGAWTETDLDRLAVEYERVAAVPGRPESVARLTTDVPTLFTLR